MTKSEFVLSVQNLDVGYAKRQVLFGVTLEVAHEEVVLIKGGNGSGKSTLLSAVFGLTKPWNENISIWFRPGPGSESLSTGNPLTNRRNGLMYLPQHDLVFDAMTVMENLSTANEFVGEARTTSLNMEEILTIFPSLIPLLSCKAGVMSGGEKRLLGVAMSLLHRPKLLMLDEPLAGLDSDRALDVVAILAKFRDRWGMAQLIVEHRTEALRHIADRTLEMCDGILIT
jgi:ABC-type branched-subunit amino acid transport system ATPase component